MKPKLILMALVLAGTAFAQSEQWLEYHTSAEARSRTWMEVSTNPPPNVALPKFVGRPLFFRWTTPLDPAGGRWICLDRIRKSGPYDRLYVDSTGDGRLDNKTPLNAKRTDQYYAYFDPVPLVFKGEDGPITYHLALQTYQNRNDTELVVGSGCWYEGMVTLDGKKMRLQLVDGNVNGTFNDLSANPYDSDRVIVEGNKSGERFLGKMIEVNGQLFRIEAARDGAFVKIEKAENVALGQVRVPETITGFTAFGTNGHFTRKPENGAFTLPAGKYRIYGWSIERKDGKGAKWELSGSGFGESSAFEVAEAGPAALEVGEPVPRRVPGHGADQQSALFPARFPRPLRRADPDHERRPAARRPEIVRGHFGRLAPLHQHLRVWLRRRLFALMARAQKGPAPAGGHRHRSRPVPGADASRDAQAQEPPAARTRFPGAGRSRASQPGCR